MTDLELRNNWLTPEKKEEIRLTLKSNLNNNDFEKTLNEQINIIWNNMSEIQKNKYITPIHILDEDDSNLLEKDEVNDVSKSDEDDDADEVNDEEKVSEDDEDDEDDEEKVSEDDEDDEDDEIGRASCRERV